MIFRYPDDPIRVPFSELDYYESQGGWMAQPKWDGWRRPLYLEDGVWQFRSKYDKGPQAATRPPEPLIAELESLKFPDGTAFDAEWMGPRQEKGRHFFVLLDLLYWGGEWMGEVPCRTRYENVVEAMDRYRCHTTVKVPNVQVVDSVDSGFMELFEKQKKNPLTEGVVLKHGDSKLIGNMGRPQDNKLWKKVKYRE